MAQQVDVKGFGLVEFPDNIERSVMLDALRRKFSQINQGQAVANSTAEPYNPGLAERAASAISSGLQKTGLISDNYRANRIGQNITMGLEALPVIGDAIGGDELGRAIREGDVIGGGFAALGAIPIAGDAAKAAGQGLYKVHNITAGGLEKARELGGLPVPSLAVAKQGAGFEGYGDISLVGTKDAFEKDPTFASDIYSARFPRVNLDIDRKAVDSEVNRLSGRVPNEFNDLSTKFYPERIKDDPDYNLSSSMANKYSFLKQQGIDIDPKEFIQTTEPQQRKMPALFDEFYGESRKPLGLLTVMNDPDFGAKADQYLSEVAQQGGFEKSDLWKDYYTDGELNRDGRVFVAKMIKNDRDASEVKAPTFDYGAANKKIDELVSQYPSEWQSYLDRQKGRLIKGKSFESRNYDTGETKKLAFNLNNAVKLMKSKSIRNQEGFNYGVGNIRAEVTPQLKSLKDIQNRRGQIVSDEEMGPVKEKFSKELDSLYEELSSAWAFDSEPGLSEFADGLANYAKGDKSDFNFNPAQAKKAQAFLDSLKDAPTEYFEIKPQRAVDLSEFYGAAVPDDASDDVVKYLESKGLKITRYKKGEREKAISELDKSSGGNVLFSGAGALMLYGAMSESEDEPTQQ